MKNAVEQAARVADLIESFEPFPKMPRLSRECIVTEKIDGTNAQIFIGEDGTFLAGSRNRWISPTDDNYGFARWAEANREQLLQLGPGRHFGEWWGQGIQRGYGLQEKRFSLFNVSRWNVGNIPECVSVVPTLYVGAFDTADLDRIVESLAQYGSQAAPGFLRPEGIVVYHTAANLCFKKTVEKDASPKGVAA